MFLGAALVVAIALAWLLGAQLSRLSELEIRAGGLVFTALGVQLVLFTRLHAAVPEHLVLPLQAVAYALLMAFLILNLRAGRALWLVVVGLAANVLPIVTNGGRMPVSRAAWTATGADPARIERAGHYANDVLAGAHSHFAWLGDVFALPSRVPYASALSLGDVLITFGLAAFIYRACVVASGEPVRLFAPLRFASFRSLILGRTISKLGDWLTMAAVVTWVFDRTHSTLSVSAFLVARILCLIVGSIAAAPLLDRIPQFRTLSSVEGLRGALTLLTLPLAANGLVAPVIAVVCASALLGSVTNPSASSLVPELLPDQVVHQGNALHGVTRNVVMVLGTGLGAFSVATLGITPSLLLDFGTFALAGILYLHLGSVAPPPEPEPAVEAPPSRRTILGSMLANRVVLGLTVSFTLVTAAMGVLNASLPAFLAHQVAQPKAYGYGLAAIGLGLMCGEFVTGFIQRDSVARRTVALAFLVSAGAVFLAAESRVAATIYLLLFILGASDGSTEIVYDTLFQRQMPRRLRGGAFALASAIQNGGMVIGFLGAPAILLIGTTSTALEVAAGGCVAGAAIAAVALLRRTRAPRAAETPVPVRAASTPSPRSSRPAAVSARGVLLPAMLAGGVLLWLAARGARSAVTRA